jgi:hypothetical protein
MKETVPWSMTDPDECMCSDLACKEQENDSQRTSHCDQISERQRRGDREKESSNQAT